MHIKKFDYSFLEKKNIPGNLLNVLTSIYSMKTANDYRKNVYERIYTELGKLAIVQLIKGSNAIEGIVTSDDRIKQIINQNSAPLYHDEKELSDTEMHLILFIKGIILYQ